MTNVVLGILAHVDAGKTTLSECLLYHTGVIKEMGRVDKQDAYLDTDIQEKQRGITIFSKQAELTLAGRPFTLLDTPGHVDFSPEAERVLSVLDYCILVISAPAGVQAHTETLWKLLKNYRVPTFVFVNKMDQYEGDKSSILNNLRDKLKSDFAEYGTEDFIETAASMDEGFMESYLESGNLPDEAISYLIKENLLHPVSFGSALKDEGIDNLIEMLGNLGRPGDYGQEFGARVFKIARDENGNRLSHVKITSGELKLKDIVSGEDAEGETYEEKLNQIRIYSGADYKEVQKVSAGDICTLVSLNKTFAGAGLGVTENSCETFLTPVLTYAVKYPRNVDTQEMLRNLKTLEEEEPELKVEYLEDLREIQVELMGEIQIEVLKKKIYTRFGVECDFGTGRIVYRETINNTVEGVGHFEPLRHYAEVHLLLEPGEPGSGLIFRSVASEDELSKNWQRLILTHLKERSHRGVLMGFPVTDMEITLLSGRAHPKHTEGGDFRQATYRAVRQGLMKAESVLLEPVYDFTLRVPTEAVGRAMTDLSKMEAKFDAPEIEGDFSFVKGRAPVSTMSGYQTEVLSYTGGLGSLDCRVNGYMPVHNQEEVLEGSNYDPETDLRNPSGSVFCTHGAGYVVPWYQVEEFMHLPLVTGGKTAEELEEYRMYLEAERVKAEAIRRQREAEALGLRPLDYEATEKELKHIFESTYGAIETKFNVDYINDSRARGTWNGKKKEKTEKPKPKKEKPEDYDFEKEAKHKHVTNRVRKTPYMLVDGYNVIFAWDELKELAEKTIDGARTALLDKMVNYQGYTGRQVIVVFDAYRVEGHKTEIIPYGPLQVVFTKEAETADQYIEKAAHDMGHDYDVIVATSDGLEQVIILGTDCALMSARELEKEVKRLNKELKDQYMEKPIEKASQNLGQLMAENIKEGLPED